MSFDDVRAALTSLSDTERRIAEGVLFGSATRNTEIGNPRLAKFWHALAVASVEERDRRRELEEHARSVFDDESFDALIAELEEEITESPEDPH
ncbi:hypothetical protein [Haloactinomyces albus]|uniref:Uncharacterized protein n=1 Tax=Haloactinomyces albus TaxID=1352928 RepID=A0AAE4CQL8_9ACTN|nr:hypothetical protein [Haloactinomyces albus]MDR7304257.1 hypothetical protein [Haloactinomyces albus]